MKNNFTLKGSVVPLVTPLTAKHELDTEALSRLLEFHRMNGTTAVFLLGTCGEGACLDDAVKLSLVKQVLKETPLPVLAGIAETGTGRAVNWARIFRDTGVSAIVLMPPTFQFALSPEEHYSHVRSVADAVPGTPLILYNMPKKCGGAIPVCAIEQIVKEGLICAIKDSSGDIPYIEELLRLRDRYRSFTVLNGELRTAAQALSLGVDGLVMSYTNVDPASCCALITTASDGKSELAAEMQAEFVATWNLFPPAASPVAKVKSILAGLGLCSTLCQAPTKALPALLPDNIKSLVKGVLTYAAP